MTAIRTPPRQEIALAWRRAALAGLHPGMPVRETPFLPPERDSRLMSAAGPVLERMSSELADTRFAIVLADRDARIVDRQMGQSGLDRALDRVCGVPGLQYTEETSGTNALATAYELRQPISVTGNEHFLDVLKVFSCYGAPIQHPFTRHLEGVLGVTGPANEATPLLGPFVMSAVREIEQRLQAGARMADQRLFSAFQAHTRRKRHAIIALGDDIVLSNDAAVDVLASSDHATLRAISREIGKGGSVQHSIVLASGRSVFVRAQAIAECPAGVLFDVVEIRQTDTLPAESVRTGATLVVGEPGTGRTTQGRALAGPHASVFAAADTPDLSRMAAAVARRQSVLLDDIHLLPTAVAARAATILRTATGHVVMTSSALVELEPEQAALAALAVERIELRPLRTRRHEFVHCATEVLRRNHPDCKARLTRSAVTALAEHSWPGNLRELEFVLAHTIQRRTCGDITHHDLPPTHRNLPSNTLTPIEAAERDTILAALRATAGNKAAAAATLGIGRTTLYDRLRRYRITC